MACSFLVQEGDMLRIRADEVFSTIKDILLSRGLSPDKAEILSQIVYGNTLDGVYTHGINRFPRIVSNIETGVLDVNAELEKISSCGVIETYDGHFGIGPVNAYRAVQRAVEIAHDKGTGIVALAHNNHWLRGSTYGLYAADNGCIAIAWSNTKPNMMPWGSSELRIGNNPLVISVPSDDGVHFVFDAAMSQFSYGKLEEYRLRGEMLPVDGGFDDEWHLTKDPCAIERNSSVIPFGFWKGSSLSIALDLVAVVFSNGFSVIAVGREGEERGLSQVFIVIDPSKISDGESIRKNTRKVLDSITSCSTRDGGNLRYAGERLAAARKDNLANGIPVHESVWNTVLGLAGRAL